MATRPRVARDRTSNQDDRESRDTSWTAAGLAPPKLGHPFYWSQAYWSSCQKTLSPALSPHGQVRLACPLPCTQE